MTMRTFRGRQHQRGIALMLYVTGALAVVGAAGLALDVGLAFLTRARLQNALDAAAIAGAYTLNQTFSQSGAITAANAAFALNAAQLPPGTVPTVEVSPTLTPWINGAPGSVFVSVSVDALASPVVLASVIPGVGDSLTMSGSAVAGPLPTGEICNALPLALCGTPGDSDCSDLSCFGFGPGEMEIKGDQTSLGPGNYGLIQSVCGNGGACVRESMAGGNQFCYTPGGTVQTKPGVTAGPTAQGLNTRFGVYQGPVSSVDYPPDVVTVNGPAITYPVYQALLATPSAWNFPNGHPQRRVASVPVVNCDPPVNGRASLPVIGAACLFLTRTVSNGDGTVYAQVVPSCMVPAGGGVPPAPGAGGAFTIALYQDIG